MSPGQCFLKPFPLFCTFRTKALLVILLSAFCTPSLATERASVVASIKPLALITTELAGPNIEVTTLLPANASPHDFALKLSDLKHLHSAELVVWLGADHEPWLATSEDNWLTHPEKSLPLVKNKELAPLLHEYRDGGGHHHNDSHSNHHDNHKDDHHNNDHRAETEHNIDPHFWLDPSLTIIAAEQIATRLQQKFPAETTNINQRLIAFNETVNTLDVELQQRLEHYKNRPFLVYHPAYNYFIERYGLQQLDVITTQPGQALSLKQLQQLDEKIAAHDNPTSLCLFREPQFSGNTPAGLQDKWSLLDGVLDPLGQDAAGYEALLTELADGLVDCLEQP